MGSDGLCCSRWSRVQDERGESKSKGCDCILEACDSFISTLVTK